MAVCQAPLPATIAVAHCAKRKAPPAWPARVPHRLFHTLASAPRDHVCTFLTFAADAEPGDEPMAMATSALDANRVARLHDIFSLGIVKLR